LDVYAGHLTDLGPQHMYPFSLQIYILSDNIFRGPLCLNFRISSDYSQDSGH